jgi:hypothetical protein
MVKTCPVPTAGFPAGDSAHQILQQTRRNKDDKTHKYWRVVDHHRPCRARAITSHRRSREL